MSMLTVQYAMEYKKEGFTFLALSPGVSITLVFDDVKDLTLSSVVENRYGLR